LVDMVGRFDRFV